jgi:superfamily I DNA/RNA helicase
MELYGASAATRTLSENYRSREPIVEVAEIVRRHGRWAQQCALLRVYACKQYDAVTTCHSA